MTKRGLVRPLGVGAFYTHPERLSDETIETYFRPFATSKLKRTQLNQFSVAMATNPLSPQYGKTCGIGKVRPEWSGG